MVGLAVLVLLGIAVYFGYVKGLHLWQAYLAERMAVLKEAEIEYMKLNSGRSAISEATKYNDADFVAQMDRNFIPWAKTKGLIR